MDINLSHLTPKEFKLKTFWWAVFSHSYKLHFWIIFCNLRKCWETFEIVRETSENLRKKRRESEKFLGGPWGSQGIWQVVWRNSLGATWWSQSLPKCFTKSERSQRKWKFKKCTFLHHSLMREIKRTRLKNSHLAELFWKSYVTFKSCYSKKITKNWGLNWNQPIFSFDMFLVFLKNCWSMTFSTR